MKPTKILGIAFTAIILCGLLSFIYPVVHFHRLTQKWKMEIQQNQDPAQLQAWAVERLTPRGDRNQQDLLILHDEPPSGIPKSRYGPYVYLMSSDHCVQLGWGSGMLGLWGMRIGDTNYVCPGGELWKPGVYFFSSP